MEFGRPEIQSAGRPGGLRQARGGLRPVGADFGRHGGFNRLGDLDGQGDLAGRGNIPNLASGAIAMRRQHFHGYIMDISWMHHGYLMDVS